MWPADCQTTNFDVGIQHKFTVTGQNIPNPFENKLWLASLTYLIFSSKALFIYIFSLIKTPKHFTSLFSSLINTSSKYNCQVIKSFLLFTLWCVPY